MELGQRVHVGEAAQAGVAEMSGLGRVIGGTRWRLGEGML